MCLSNWGVTITKRVPLVNLSFFISWETQGKDGVPLITFDGIYSSLSLSNVSIRADH